MNSYYGWTYAGRTQAPARRIQAAKINRYLKPLRRATILRLEQAAASRDWSLGKVSRAAVTVLLVVLSVVVLGKDQTSRAEVLEWAAHCWQSAQTWVGKDRPDKARAESARKGKDSRAVPEPIRPLPAVPVALLLDRSLFVVDAAGTIWPLLDENPPADLPVLTGILVREEPGDMGVAVRAEVDMDLVRRLLAAPIKDRISEIHFGSHEGVILYTRDGLKVLLRKARQLDRDLLRLEAVLADIRARQEKIALIDLRYGQHVVVRPKSRR